MAGGRGEFRKKGKGEDQQDEKLTISISTRCSHERDCQEKEFDVSIWFFAFLACEIALAHCSYTSTDFLSYIRGV